MTRLLRAQPLGRVSTTLLALAALAVLVGGVEHARLFHRGYAHVDVVGPLFLLNAIGSAAVVLLLLAERVWLFVAGAVSISAGALVSIYISHTASFFRFSESGYDTTARIIVGAEIAALVLALIGAATVGRGRAA